MRLITLERARTGVILAKSIFHEDGKILLASGTELTDSLIRRLKQFHVFTVYIEDEVSEGIEIVESIPEELRVESIDTITNGLKIITDLNTSSSNIPGMLQTERAVQSFQKVFASISSSLIDNRTALNLLASTKILDNHLYTHSLNVSIYSCQLAIENGLPVKQIQEIGLGALLHDLGKMLIPNEVINKPGRLTKEEFEQVKAHSELGFEILRNVHGIPLTVAHCALQHHERVDGTGYPRGINGDKIHPYAKILSVADVFDAVSTNRSYRPAMLPHKGIEVLYAGADTQFERKQIQLFKGCIAIYPPGLTVKLNDGRMGIVSKYNINAVGRPEIRIIRDEVGETVAPYEIDLARNNNLTLEIIEADALLQ